MATRGHTVVQGHATGLRAAVGGPTVVLVEITTNMTQGVELPPVPVLPLGADSDGQAGEFT